MSNSHMIGFLGIEKYDLMHYLSRILYHLGKKVLLIDESGNWALKNSIPVPEDTDTIKGVIEYRGVFFTEGLQGLKHYKLEYDYIFIDFGFLASPNMEDCRELIYVTDQQKSNLCRLNQEIFPTETEDRKNFLLIRNMIKGKFSLDFILSCLDQISIAKDHCMVLYPNRLDSKALLSCQWDSIFKFDLSAPYRDLLYEMIVTVLELPKKEVMKAIRKAERGK